MYNLQVLQNATFVVFLLLAIYIFGYYYLHNEEPNILDSDGDGQITKKEVIEFINRELDNRAKRPPQFKGIVKSALSGAMRGAVMGLILNGLEGAAAGAIILGSINPIITSLEHIY